MSHTQKAALDLAFSALAFLLYFLEICFTLSLPVLFALLHVAIRERDTGPPLAAQPHRGRAPETGAWHSLAKCVSMHIVSSLCSSVLIFMVMDSPPSNLLLLRFNMC